MKRSYKIAFIICLSFLSFLLYDSKSQCQYGYPYYTNYGSYWQPQYNQPYSGFSNQYWNNPFSTYNPYQNQNFGFNWGNPQSSPWYNSWNNPWGTSWNNPGGNLWSNPVWQPYQNYAWGQPWQGVPSSYGYFPPNYGWSPMSPPYSTYTPNSWLTSHLTDTSRNLISDESIDDEEYSVLSALIEEEYASSANILILNHSYRKMLDRVVDEDDEDEDEDLYDRIGDNLEDLEEETIEDFLEKNDKSYYFEENFSLDENYVLVSKNQQMYNVLKISRVGFNSDEDQAIVYVEYIWASLGGEGYYFFLIKEDGEWKVEDKVLTMMA